MHPITWIRRRQARLRDLWDSITDSLWYRPLAWLGGLSLLAVALVLGEWSTVDPKYWDELHVLWQIEAEGARTMLGAIAGAILTVVSLAFSLMMVVVIQAANAYTPRLLRQYIADPHNHHVLGLLMGSFSYALIVLRAVKESPTFVPYIAVNMALVLSLANIIALVSFIHHVARSIEVGQIIHLITEQTRGLLQAGRGLGFGRAYEGELTRPAGRAVPLKAPISGYLRRYDHAVIEQVIGAWPCSVELHHPVGAYLVQGQAAATLWVYGHLDDEAATCDRVMSGVVLGRARNHNQDVRYGFDQLNDIALKALSPGINDPTTAVMALDAIFTLMALWLEAPPRPARWADDDGTLRVVFAVDTVEDVLRDVLWHIYDYGEADHVIVARLASGLRVLIELAPLALRGPYEAALETLRERVDASRWSPLQRDQVAALLG